MSKTDSISACLVIHNEVAVLRRCLESVRSLVDEIIVVHDGECSDQSLDIAREFTDQVFVLPFVGIAEPHRTFSILSSSNEWILQIDADEFIDQEAIETIKHAVGREGVNGYILKWEMWDGQRPVYIHGFQKRCLFRKSVFHFCGIPQSFGSVDGDVEKLDVFLRHRPSYNNISWKHFWRKSKKWIEIHSTYFFPERISIDCFQSDITEWKKFCNSIRHSLLRAVVTQPLKMFLGQLKNGLFLHWIGWQICLQQYVYYLLLYLRVWKMNQKLK